MLNGFTVPRSPLGTAALAPPPPWPQVTFWPWSSERPDAAADILPRGVSAGAPVALFADCQFTANSDEYLIQHGFSSASSSFLDATW